MLCKKPVAPLPILWSVWLLQTPFHLAPTWNQFQWIGDIRYRSLIFKNYEHFVYLVQVKSLCLEFLNKEFIILTTSRFEIIFGFSQLIIYYL